MCAVHRVLEQPLRWVGLCLGVSVMLAIPPASAATEVPELTMEQLLSADSFGLCVPEYNLEEIWIVLAKGGPMGRAPHVCMTGTCDDLPDIAEWAAAQGYPDDIDLERQEVQAGYAAFVARACGTADAPPDDWTGTPPGAAEPPGAAPGDTPWMTSSRTSSQPPARTATALPPRRASPPGSAPLLPPFPVGGGLISTSSRSDPPSDPLAPPFVTTGDDLSSSELDRTPVGTVPLPAGGWLLLSATGLGLWLGRRRRPGTAATGGPALR